jgi:hypothetical protein
VPSTRKEKTPYTTEEIQHFLGNRRTHVGMLEQLLARSKDPAKRKELEKKLQTARADLAEATCRYEEALKAERKET